MEEIREVALAYYATASENCKNQIRNFFFSLDTDGNGLISVEEFRCYMQKTYPKFDKVKLFQQLDQDDDGVLDFEEVIVFYYLVTVRNRACDGTGCGEFLNRVYFTCALCFLDKENDQNYDLCIKCYKNKKYDHRSDHKLFLDNYVMLTLAHEEFNKKESPNSLDTTPNYQHSSSRSITVQQGYDPHQIQSYPYQMQSYPHQMQYTPHQMQYTPHQMQYNHQFVQYYASYAMPPTVYAQNQPVNNNNLNTAFSTINHGCNIGITIVQLAALAGCTIM